MGLAALGLSNATLQAFAAALQGMVMAGIVSALASYSPASPGGKVSRLYFLHLRFACGVAGDSDLPPIWDVVALGRGKAEGLATLNQALTRGLPSCQRLLEGGDALQRLPPISRPSEEHLTDKTLPGPSVLWGGGVTPWLTIQGTVEASTRGGADASLLAQQLDRCLASADSLQTAARVRLATIPLAEEALRDLGTLSLVSLHLFSAGRRHSYAVVELLRIIKSLEELRTEV